jgi:restriction system protein
MSSRTIIAGTAQMPLEGMRATIIGTAQLPSLPAVTLHALLDFGSYTDDGRLVEAVAPPWYSILEMLRRDPASAYQIDPFKWEEIIAGAYDAAGFDEVVLTPRSGDGGRDVIATRHGIGSIRIFDQVRAYTPPHVVTAEQVRAMLGVITGHQNVSKGVISTTSEFAPRLMEDKAIASHVPYRLELKPRDDLLKWLEDLRAKGKQL